MRILYGVVGEGMGHATRSAVVIAHLLDQGHHVRVVVSGRAHAFLQQRFDAHPRFALQEIQGLGFAMDGMEVDLEATVLENLERAPEGLLRNLLAYSRVVQSGLPPEVVISDFESWAYLYARNHFLPVVSLDNMQVLNRCTHPPEVAEDDAFQLAKLAVKLKLPGAWHYLVTSFFFPGVRKPRTTLVPPILRPEILAARREPGEHVVVYQAAAALTAWLPVLATLPWRFKVYGSGREGTEGNLELCPFSARGFVDDLRTARSVLAGGGFSLMSEAVHLGVPYFAVPLGQQYEQALNAQYLTWLGYGDWAPLPERERLLRFLATAEDCAQALERYPRQDNTLALTCVDEILARIADDEDRPERLDNPGMGCWEG